MRRGDFDDDLATAVERAEYFLQVLLLVVFDGDNHLFDMVLFDKLFDVADGAEAGYDGGEAAFGVGGVVAVDGDVAGEYVARVFLLVFEVEVGLVGLVVAADEEGGEADLAVVDLADDAGGLDDAEEVGESEVDGQQEEEREVVAAVAAHLVVEHQGEEEDHHAEDAGQEGLLELFEARFAEHVLIGALEGVEAQPAQRHQHDAEPEVAVVEHLVHVHHAVVFDTQFSEQEKQGPRHHGGGDV